MWPPIRSNRTNRAGDNLDVVRRMYSGSVDPMGRDPPFNTSSALPHLAGPG